MKRDEVTDTRAVGTTVDSGGDLTIVSGNDQVYQKARLDAGDNLTLSSGGDITFAGAMDTRSESHEKSKSNWAWQSAKGKGNTDETLRQSELVAQGQLAINAANRVNIDVRDIDQQSVSQTIDAMVAAEPELAWLKQAEAQGDVDWRQVKEIHDRWDYKQSGLGEGAALAVSIAAAAVVGPAVGGLAGSGLMGAMATGAAGSLAGTSAVSLINNRGNLGATLSDSLSSGSLKGALIAAASAGISQGMDSVWGGETDPATGRIIPHNLSTWEGTGRFAGQLSSQALADAGLQSAINGGSLNDNLKQNLQGAVTTVLEASLFNQVGNLGDRYPEFLADGGSGKTVLHALAGGLAAEATGGDFRTGAIAAGANEALINQLNGLVKGDKKLLIAASQITGIVAAGMTDGDVQKGAEIAGNATSYNHLRHEEVQALSDELDACKEKGNCSSEDVDKILAAYENLSAENASAIADCNSRSCVEGMRSQLTGFNDPAAKNIFNTVNGYFAYDVAGLLQGDPSRLAGEDQTFGNHQSNRGFFLPITDLAQSKILQEGWLSDSEKIKLKKWDENTFYLNKLAGHELSQEEKIKFGGDLTSFAAMTVGGGSKSKASSQGAVANKKITSVIANEATNNNAHAALKAKLSGLQKAQKNAANGKTLPDGRKRYYMEETPARTEGPTRGSSFVTEYNPLNGKTRQWMESYNHSGKVVRVHPKSINGQTVNAQHYPPTGKELENWK